MERDFTARAPAALNDAGLRRNFRRAMDGLMAKRAAQFTDREAWTALRARGAAIRARALARLPELLERFEARCRDNGIQVHWAETPAEANAIVLGILRDAGATRVIKGKSMVSEEMELNAHLLAHGVTPVESDLGEYIIQLAGEAPSHIVMPCIHKNKAEIARLFADAIDGQPYTEDVDELTAAARRVLRGRFAEADAGISGVNFAVAETGTLVLIENEGNGRLSTTLPPLHIAVTGIEKVVETLEDVPPLLALLPRSATGQPITTYVNMISGPRKAGERDGPRAVHVVLLDNGRSRVHGDVQLADTLRCIRCGACMNHCPVYSRVGGHTYKFVYPGPIGKILSPQLEGLDCAGDQPHASTLCNACVEVCPVEIPIAELLVRLRTEAVTPRSGAVKGGGSGRTTTESLAWAGWRLAHSSPVAYAALTRALAAFGNLGGPLMTSWTHCRTQPRFAGKSLHRLAREAGYADQEPLRAAARARSGLCPDPPSCSGDKSETEGAARTRLLARLKGAPYRPAPALPVWSPPTFPDRAARFRAMLEASHAEVHDVTPGTWRERLRDILAAKGVRTLLVAPSVPPPEGVTVIPYDRPVEELKDTLVAGVDAALTTSAGGIAETGTLVLMPTPDEPRLMSLLPPIHIALVEESRLCDSLAEAMAAGGWAGAMPTNLVLVSGPSKTADIEQTLAYGVHGPKELVVLLVRRPRGQRPGSAGF